jgi:hypothetical protein
VVRGLTLLALLARLLLWPAPSLAGGPSSLDGGGQQRREQRVEHGSGSFGLLSHPHRIGKGGVSAGLEASVSAGLEVRPGATLVAAAAEQAASGHQVGQAGAGSAARVGARFGQVAVMWARFEKNWMLYCTIPVVAGLLNWATNNLAVKMIFYPLNFWGLKLKTWPDTPFGLLGLASPLPLGSRLAVCVRTSTRACLPSAALAPLAHR